MLNNHIFKLINKSPVIIPFEINHKCQFLMYTNESLQLYYSPNICSKIWYNCDHYLRTILLFGRNAWDDVTINKYKNNYGWIRK